MYNEYKMMSKSPPNPSQ